MIYKHIVFISSKEEKSSVLKLTHHLEYLILDMGDVNVWGCKVYKTVEDYVVIFLSNAAKIELDENEWIITDHFYEEVAEEEKSDATAQQLLEDLKLELDPNSLLIG